METPQDINQKLAELEKKIDAMYASVEKTRKYLQWTLIISVAVIVLPMLLIPLVAGSVLSQYSAALEITQ